MVGTVLLFLLLWLLLPLLLLLPPCAADCGIEVVSESVQKLVRCSQLNSECLKLVYRL